MGRSPLQNGRGPLVTPWGRYPEQAAAARDAVATEGDPNDVTEQTYHHHRAR